MTAASHEKKVTATPEIARFNQAGRAEDACKTLYELGESPPLGHVPARMYASTIR